MVDVADEIGC